jgi:hypothetical protein
MEITYRDAITVLHGMGFGAVLLLGFSGAAMALYALAASSSPWTPSVRERRYLTVYFGLLALLAWIAVLAGTYVIYPWYRAHPPAGTTNLTGFPKALLISSPTTTGWHDLGMEWKEHIAWFSPLSLTVVTYLVARYGVALRSMPGLRNAVVGLLVLGLFSTGVAGLFGAMLNKYAPVRGGTDIVIMKGESHDK